MTRICVLAAPADLNWIRDTVAELSIRHRWPDCELDGASRPADWGRKLGAYGSADLIICDIAVRDGPALLRQARSANPAALVIPLVTAEIPPSVYVRPEILPFCLLWHPLKARENREMLEKALLHTVTEKAAPEERYLAVKGKRESHQIPYREICFFEAREKKVFIHLPEQEIPINDTLSELEERVPAQFLRCHKSFLVNGEMIESVDWSAQMIRLRRGTAVPISRSCRAKVKERINGTD